jgi:hypothetical protein
MKHTERAGSSAGLWSTCTLLRRVCKVSVCVEIWVRCLACARTHWASYAAFHLWTVIKLSRYLGCNWRFCRCVRLIRTRDYVRCPHFPTNAPFLFIYFTRCKERGVTWSVLNRKVHYECSVDGQMQATRPRTGLSKVEWYIPSTLFHRIYFHVRCGYSAMWGLSNMRLMEFLLQSLPCHDSGSC